MTITSDQIRETANDQPFFIPNPDDTGLVIFGNSANYLNTGSPQNANETQLTRVWLYAHKTYTQMRTVVTGGTAAGRNIQMGVYAQASPTSPAGTPTGSSLASTAITLAAVGVQTIGLSAAFTPSVSGYYWLALQATNQNIAFLLSNIYEADTIARREITGAGLPSGAFVTTSPRSSVLYCALVE